ncbi:MAG: hypothetical protein PHC78_04640 [Verrucomicrobiota bacterium]|nr:hypothetical protein [Verrucomicrobiota bacterium]
MLVRDLFDQAVHGLELAAIEGITQLPAMDAQPAAQFALLLAQVFKRRGLTHTKLFQRHTRGILGNVARLPDDALESAPENFV